MRCAASAAMLTRAIALLSIGLCYGFVGLHGSRRQRPSARMSLPTQQLHYLDVQRIAGASIGPVPGAGEASTCVLTYTANEDSSKVYERLNASLHASACVLDVSCFGLIKVGGEDRLRFLHNQATNAFDTAAPNSVLPASFVTSTGRMLDYVRVLVLEAEAHILCSPTLSSVLLKRFEKYIFPLDRVAVKDCSMEYAGFVVAGRNAEPIVQSLIQDPSVSLSKGVWTHNDISIIPGTDLALPGFTVLVPYNNAANVWQQLCAFPDMFRGGYREWNWLRIIQGRPVPGSELTEDMTPLECGLFHSVHFDKGCYMGQETLAKVNNANAARKKLFGVRFNSVSPIIQEGGTLVTFDDESRVGTITSLAPSGVGTGKSIQTFGLAFIRKAYAVPGQRIKVQGSEDEGEVIEIPFATRNDAEAAAPPAAKKASGSASDTANTAESDTAKRAAKLEANRKKLEALKAKKQTG